MDDPSENLEKGDIVSFNVPWYHHGTLTGVIDYVIVAPRAYHVKINDRHSFVIHSKNIVGGYKHGSLV